MDWRTEGKDFLRSRRDRLTPADGALGAASSRRRVPGLRREEVAQLAGVSVDYYTRLEKGHLETASLSVLEGIARALQLNRAERSHLFALTRAAKSSPSERALQADARGVHPSLQWMLDAMSMCPAYIRNGRLDVLAANSLGRALYAPMFDSGGRSPNLATFCFLDPRATRFFPDWREVAEGTVALLRAQLGRTPFDFVMEQLIDRLMAGSDSFRDIWADHEVREIVAETKRIRHEGVGMMSLVVQPLYIAMDTGFTMVTYAAEPRSESSERLLQLAQQTVMT